MLDRIRAKSTETNRSNTWPARPGPQYLSLAIRLFYIARDTNGFWVAREANGDVGGQFLFRRSAYRFARTMSPPYGGATMLLIGRYDLDLPNRGSLIVALLLRLKRCLWIEPLLALRPRKSISHAVWRSGARL